MPKSKTDSTLDASAITFSALCVIHCLALPVLTATLSLSAVWLEQEWIHRMFVVAGIPITGFAVYTSLIGKEGVSFSVAASAGLSLLTAAAFLESLHHYETTLTVAGAGILVLAHASRWARRHWHADNSCE